MTQAQVNTWIGLATLACLIAFLSALQHRLYVIGEQLRRNANAAEDQVFYLQRLAEIEAPVIGAALEDVSLAIEQASAPIAFSRN